MHLPVTMADELVFIRTEILKPAIIYTNHTWAKRAIVYGTLAAF